MTQPLPNMFLPSASAGFIKPLLHGAYRLVRCSGIAAVVLGAVLLSTATGCTPARLGGSTPPDKVIDEQRLEIVELRKQIDQWQKNSDLRLAEIDALKQQLSGASPLPRVDAVRVVSLQFDRYSGPVDTDGDKRDDLVRVYVKPKDQEDRFLPVSGQASVHAVLLRQNQSPLVLAKRAYTPEQWSGAYRTGITGTHFTLELPLDSADVSALSKGVHEITLLVSVTDAATGVTLTRQAVYPLRR